MKYLLNPSIFFISWLIVISICAKILFSANLPFILLLLLLSVLFGYLVSLPHTRYRVKNNYFQIKYLNRLFWFCLVFWTYTQLSIFYSLVQYFDLSNPSFTKDLVTNSFFENEGLGFKETGKGIASMINTLFYILGFPSLILGSIILIGEDKKIGLLPVIIGAVTSLISFSRFHMFVYISIFGFTSLCFKRIIGEKIIINKQLITVIIFGVLLFSIPALLRDKGDEKLDIFNYTSVYLFGGISAFSKWFDESKFDTHLWGNLNGTSFYTLKTWLSYIKLSKPPISLHYEFLNIDEKNYTNVYSLFRPILEDFGLIPVLILLFIFSFFSNFVYRKVFVYKKLNYLPILVFLLTFSLFIFYTSIFSDFRIFLGTIFSILIFKNFCKTKHQIN